MKIAKSAGDDVVSIPADLLVSLLSNMQTMQLQLGGLRAELSTVKGDLRTLEAASGMTFPRFEKLPLEIRRMIWRMALSMPRVIGLEHVHRVVKRRGKNRDAWTYLQAKGINPLRYTCPESRAEAITMQTRILPDRHYEAPHVYINPDVDVVWYRLEDEGDDMWIALENLGYNDTYPGTWDLAPGRTQSKTPQVAVSLKFWDSWARGQVYLVLNRFYELGVKKIYIVVGEHDEYYGPTPAETDLVLIEPLEKPHITLSDEVKQNMERDFEKKIHGMSWEELGKAEMEEVRKFQKERADVRAEMAASKSLPIFSTIYGSVKLIHNIKRW